MRASHVTTLLLSITPLASAFPWPRWLPEIDALVVRRQDDTTSSTSTAKATQTATAEASSTSTSDADATDLNTASATASKTGSSSDDATTTGTGDSSSSTGDSSSSNTTANSPGSAVVTFPVTTLTSAYYKIGDFVTFKWNYTGLTASPTAVNVVATASTSSLGASTWTLTSNMTFETAAAFTWDTGTFQSQAQADQKPLVVEMYTLYIQDAEQAAVTETAAYGALTANAALTFGMYTAEAYNPITTGWTCATCSGALSSHERQAVGLLFAMFGVTVLSFTWFVTGLC